MDDLYKYVASTELPATNISSQQCPGDINRSSCFLPTSTLGVSDAIAAIRMLISCLSILGSWTIIYSAVKKKQVLNPKVHPIFVLSVADMVLALLWVAGATMWLRKTPNRVWCFAVSLPTIILECTTVNLTLVYALLAYASIRQMNLGTILNRTEHNQAWPAWQIITAYILSVLIPMVILMTLFGILAGQEGIVRDANRCSCWCYPTLGNVLPYAVRRDAPTAIYVYNIRKLIATYGMIVGTNYLIVFVLLIVVYRKILRYILKVRREFVEQSSEVRSYGTTETQLRNGQSKARRKTFFYLTVFIVNGLANFLLAYAFVIYQSIKLTGGPTFDSDLVVFAKPIEGAYTVLNILLLMQSVTVPIQGFLNALVYGWTREDFLLIMASHHRRQPYELEHGDEDIDGSVSCGIEDSGFITKRGHGGIYSHTIIVTTDAGDSLERTM